MRLELPNVNGVNSTEKPAVNSEGLAELRGLPGDDGEELLPRIIEMFLEDAPKALTDLSGALAAGDARAVVRIAHTMKGCGAYFGAHRFQELCNAMEQAGKAGDLEPVAGLLSQTGHELQRVIAALELEIEFQPV